MTGKNWKPALRPTRAALRQGRMPASTTVEAICQRIQLAITEHRLPPGTKLGEEYLCGIFNVSRTKIRQALFHLADEKLVTIVSHRGAFVAQPEEQEARDVFEARRIVECAIVAKAARIATPAQIARLRAQHLKEREALSKDALYIGTSKGTRFLGEFHSIIADMSGNQVLSDLLQELTARTAVIEILYRSSMTPDCSAAEHAELLACIERGDSDAASQCMEKHLSHIEDCLRLRPMTRETIDLEAVFAEDTR